MVELRHLRQHPREDQMLRTRPIATDRTVSQDDDADAIRAMRLFNDEHEANRDLWARARHATDTVRHARDGLHTAQALAEKAATAYLVAQAEFPERRAARPRQLLLAAITIGLDAVACNFAAQALGDGQRETLLWTGLFLAVLAAGEIALDAYRERQRGVAWRVLAVGLAGFVLLLGVLRYSFLITVAPLAPATAVLGALAFTVATGSFVVLGYRALRSAETAAIWKARRRKHATQRQVRVARTALQANVATRDRLTDAYLSQIRASLLKTCRGHQLVSLEQAIRTHLGTEY